MNRSALVIVAFLLLVCGFTVGNATTSDKGLESTALRSAGHEVVPAGSYTQHDPIYIDSNDDFAAQGWPGNGTEGNPYVIEELNITDDGVCISITFTTVHFEIVGCLISAPTPSANSGIRIEELSNGTVRDCVVTMHSNGIVVGIATDCTMVNNTLVGNSASGIRIYESYDCTLTNNTAADNAENGFYVFYSDGNVLTNNTATNNTEYGFRVYESQSTVLTNNTAAVNGVTGICVQFSGASVLTGNAATNNTVDGFRLLWSNDCILTGNRAKENDNAGLGLASSNACIMTDNTATGDLAGIYLDSSNDCTLTGNTVYNSPGTAIGLLRSDHCNLTSNTATGSSSGIVITFSNRTDLSYNIAKFNYFGFYVYDSHNNTLADNAADDNYLHGFYLGMAENHTLRNNTAISNDRYGIYLEQSSNCTLFLNRLETSGLSNGLDDGGLDNSWDNGTHGNYWDDYDGEGVYEVPGTTGSIDRYPFLLDLLAPTIDTPLDVAYEEGAEGYSITWFPHDAHPSTYVVYLDGGLLKSGPWNSTSEMIVLSVDGHGLGTYNYTIVVTDIASKTAVDTVLVTVRDGTPPTIDHPADITYTVGATGHSITWTPSDAHPASYEMYVEDVLSDSGIWTGSPMTVDVDGLAVGTYNYTLVVTDVGGNSVADVVMVIVTAVTTTTTTATTTTTTTATMATTTTTTTTGPTTTPDNTLMLLVLAGGAVAVVVVVIVVLRMRKKG